MGKEIKLTSYVNCLVKKLTEKEEAGEVIPKAFALSTLEEILPKKSILLEPLYIENPWLAIKLVVKNFGARTWKHIEEHYDMLHKMLLEEMKLDITPCICGQIPTELNGYYQCTNPKCVICRSRFKTKSIEEWESVITGDESYLTQSDITPEEEVMTDPNVEKEINAVVGSSPEDNEGEDPFPNHGKKWTREDEEKLEFLYKAGKTIEDLSEIFGRKSDGIEKRLEKLGLIEVNKAPEKNTTPVGKSWQIHKKLPNGTWLTKLVTFVGIPEESEVIEQARMIEGKVYDEWDMIKYFPIDGSIIARAIQGNLVAAKPQPVTDTPKGMEPKSVAPKDIPTEKEGTVTDPFDFANVTDDF